METIETPGVAHFELIEISSRYQVRIEYRPNDQRGHIGIRFYRFVDGVWVPRNSGIYFAATRFVDVMKAMQAMQQHIEDNADGR